jgi:hypothetical protein
MHCSWEAYLASFLTGVFCYVLLRGVQRIEKQLARRRQHRHGRSLCASK